MVKYHQVVLLFSHIGKNCCVPHGPSAKKLFTNQLRRISGIQQHDTIYFKDPIDSSEKHFHKILISNRGEIACRVIKTAKKMGIKTVAVYSTADSNSLHVKMADEAVCIGPPAAKESYLDTEKILKAVEDTGAQAVHPGYGFLSENSQFVAELEKRNIVFIGPSAKAIVGMGDKLESKRLAMAAGVNTIPGFDGVIKDADHCVSISRDVGYPVMIKASAGGGGKGMRIAYNDNDAREGFKLSSQEAASSFGDDRMLVEKFIDTPRHIEIQVLADKHGNTIYLNERECSIQRRNQKVIEEAPSIFLDAATRAKMGEQAVSLCKRLGYYSAGTVEFLVDSQKQFYFLEMNTRLQVEHPITESITGIDLVHQMIRVAEGYSLKHTQSDIEIRGWSIESRVYAEDPYKNFGLPSIGRLYKYIEPTHIPGVRCDSGVEEGSAISVYYDPMICKLVCSGPTRQDAIATSLAALDSYVIRGVTHNIPLLRDILTEDNFTSGNISTNYLPQTYPKGFTGRTLSVRDEKKLTALAAAIFVKKELRSYDLVSGKLMHPPPTKWTLVVMYQDKEIDVEVELVGDKIKVYINDETLEVKNSFNLASPLIQSEIDTEPLTSQFVSKTPAGHIHLIFEGSDYKIRVLTKDASELAALLPKKQKSNVSKTLLAPMPGIVKSVTCQVGDKVYEGQELCIIEAMKMQNSLPATQDAVVKTINIKAGDQVAESEILIEFQ
ncbi:unnamed protein product [Bemisia tabaci]|uniref:Propionyl-CoA carboxylase alpha chain, mitochondrial n=2 Tax=Bemisia tabaci TaxID=7038 RepID=A0A9P0A096_BEMTA|nr:unnamed protein product [Bemisia tabaci]